MRRVGKNVVSEWRRTNFAPSNEPKYTVRLRCDRRCAVSVQPPINPSRATNRGRLIVPTLSIVISSLAGAGPLERGLVTVLANRPRDSEVIVVHRHDYDDPYDLRDEVRFIHVQSRCGLVECFHRGLREASAPFVHCLQAGLEVTAGWCVSALAHFDDPLVAAVAPEVVETDPCEFPHSLATISGSRPSTPPPAASQGSAQLIPGPDVRAAFYRRELIERLRVPALNLGDDLTDVDFALALRQTGHRAVLEPNSRIFFPREECDPPHDESSPSAFRRGLYAERLFWRNFRNPQWSHPLWNHVRVVAQAYRKAPSTKAGLLHVLGRLLASCQIGNYWRHHRRLAAVAGSQDAVGSPAVTLSVGPLVDVPDAGIAPLGAGSRQAGELRRAG